MNRKDSYALAEIALWPKTKVVTLPNVQRGFVWKASQIENLWDSILRGYPIGAFVMSPKKEKNGQNESGKYEMLDGQQRATAICLGFASETFRNTKYRVFIDLNKPDPSDNREYVFRVITPSQPWGYQWTDNTKTISADNKRKAMEDYKKNCGVSDPFHQDAINNLYPYDASLPVPFEYFITGVINEWTNEKIIGQILRWLKEKGKYSQWFEQVEKITKELDENPKSKKSLPKLSEEEIVKQRIIEIYLRAKKYLNTETGLRIPALYLNIDDIDNRQNFNDHDLNTSTNEDELEESDSIENLFIRLNDGGTPLRGEELNYSILKANIEEQLQSKIEEACKGFMKPSRFISISFRLFQHINKYEGHDGLSLKIKPKQFQRAINEKKNKAAFLAFLEGDLLQPKAFYNNKTLLEYARQTLEFDKSDCIYGLPYLMVCNLADKAPEIMFLYLFRLMGKANLPGDKFEFGTDTHKKMLGILTILIWLGKSEKQRNYNTVLRNLWPAAEILDTELFWSSIAVQRGMLNETFKSPPSKTELKRLEEVFLKNVRRDTDIIKKRLNLTRFADFIDNMLTYKNRDLVLYGQRSFLDKFFSKQQFHLDDTNMPFDWDHISPNSYVYGLQDIPPILKQWYNSNGNFRAWPYALNRMDQDVTPALKLDPLNKENYYSDEELKFQKATESWAEFIQDNTSLIKDAKQLTHCLIEWSACDKEWANCYADNFKLKNNWEIVYRLIVKRNFKLLNKWHAGLCIEELVPKKNKEKFSLILNRITWSSAFNITVDKMITRYLKDELIYEDSKTWVSKKQLVNGIDFYFYIIHDKYSSKMIMNKNTTFGIILPPLSKYQKLLKIPDSLKDNYITDGKSFIQGFFTLTSHENISYIHLIHHFGKWIKGLSDKSFAKGALELFGKSIKSNFKGNL